MTWNGDISRMGKLASNVARLASVPSRAAVSASARIAKLIAEELDNKADPYGNAWAPHAQATIERHGVHPILELSGDMRRGIEVKPMRAAGVSITIPHPAEDHQTGWSGPQGSGPARPILPGNTFPARWREAVSASVQESVKEVMGGAT